MIDPLGAQEPDIVTPELDDLMSSNDLSALHDRSIEDLRALRDRLAEVEAGLSFGRRIAQGRLDIVLAEAMGRAQGNCESTAELVGRLPEVLSGQSRGGGQPRAIRDVELPASADEILSDLDELLHPTDLINIGDMDDDAIERASVRISGYERAISAKRREVHRIIDEVQHEIVVRYRSGAVSVDDLLRG